MTNHPELKLYNFKLNSLEIEKRYRTQQLLPKATFNYNFLEKGFQWTAPKTVLFENNFQYGLALNIPLRLSAERGEYKKVRYTIQSTTLEQDLKRLQIENKVRASFFEVECEGEGKKVECEGEVLRPVTVRKEYLDFH